MNAVTNAKERLPFGTWLSIRHLPKGTTEESLSAALYQQSGLNIPPDKISVRQHDFHASAMFTVTEDMLAEILNWILEPVKLNGEGISVLRPRRQNNPVTRRGDSGTRHGSSERVGRPL
jgi:hypothetical protein